MAHPSPEELQKKLHEAQMAGEQETPSTERLKRHRELMECCPAFTPNLLEYARLLPRDNGPHVDAEAMLAEVQRALLMAVQGSNRGAAEVLAYARFVDTFRHTPGDAERLYLGGAAKASRLLEEAWTSLLDSWTLENNKKTLARDFAAHTGLIGPGEH